MCYNVLLACKDMTDKLFLCQYLSRDATRWNANRRKQERERVPNAKRSLIDTALNAMSEKVTSEKFHSFSKIYLHNRKKATLLYLQ